jgi:hypothetical protein
MWPSEELRLPADAGQVAGEAAMTGQSVTTTFPSL